MRKVLYKRTLPSPFLILTIYVISSHTSFFHTVPSHVSTVSSRLGMVTHRHALRTCIIFCVCVSFNADPRVRARGHVRHTNVHTIVITHTHTHTHTRKGIHMLTIKIQDFLKDGHIFNPKRLLYSLYLPLSSLISEYSRRFA